MTIEPPKADDLFAEPSEHPRDYDDLLAHVMEMRDCTLGQAQNYIRIKGVHDVDAEVTERWTQ